MQRNPSEWFLQDRVERSTPQTLPQPRCLLHQSHQHIKNPPTFSSEDVLESHTFPIFMGTGTVSRRRGGVRVAPSILSSSPRPLVWKPAWFISSCPSTQNARVWYRRQQSAFVLGGVYLFRSFCRSLLPVMPKKCQTSDGGRFWHNPPPNHHRLRVPVPPSKKKKQRTFFRALFR